MSKHTFEIDLQGPNKNGRFYPKETLDKAIAEWIHNVDEGRAICQMSPPTDLECMVDLSKASHQVTDLVIDDRGIAEVEIKTLPTIEGISLEKLIEDDHVDMVSIGFGVPVPNKEMGVMEIQNFVLQGFAFVPKGQGSQHVKLKK